MSIKQMSHAVYDTRYHLVMGAEIWDLYLQYCKETNDDTPCIIIEKNREYSFPALEMPTAKKWLCFDKLDRVSITLMIAFIKKIKSNLKGKILRDIENGNNNLG